MNNAALGTILVIVGISVIIGGMMMIGPSTYGANSFFLLVSLGTLAFVDIQVLNHIKEAEAAKK